MSDVATSPIDAVVPDEAVVSAQMRGPWVQWWSIQQFDWTEARLPIADLPDTLVGLRIVHLSDLHFRDVWFSGYDQVIGRLAAHPPDLVLITGDFVEARADHRPALPHLRRFLSRLQSRLGIFGILGNHDGDLLGARLPQMGVTLINGRTARLESRHASIELIGLPGVHRRDLTRRRVRCISRRTPGVPRIVLSHYPDHIRKLDSVQPDVVLAGHTHGGQVCLPNGFAPLTHDALPRRMSKGIHRVRGSWLVVSRGMGFATWRVRAFCPAEVIELELARAQAN